MKKITSAPSWYYLFVCLLLFLSPGCGENENKRQTTLEIKPEPDAAPVSFLFVGAAKEHAGIYRYVVDSPAAKLVWTPKKGRILDFRYNDARTKAFILTAASSGKMGAFPYVKNVSVNVLDVATGEVAKSKNFGSGIQAAAYWQDSGVVRLVMNVIDKTIATYVQQKTTMLSVSAKILFEEKKTFDLTKDGYPLMPSTKPGIVAPSGGFSLRVTETNEVYLRKPGKKQIKIIGASAFRLSQVEWSGDAKFVILSTQNITPSNESLYDSEPKTANMYVYSIEEETIVYKSEGAGYKNLILLGSLLFYDDGFSKGSCINIYNLTTRKLHGSITLGGGCGLRGIPVIPDYGA